MRPAWSTEQARSRTVKALTQRNPVSNNKINKQKKWSDASSGVLKTDTDGYQREDRGNGG